MKVGAIRTPHSAHLALSRVLEVLSANKVEIALAAAIVGLAVPSFAQAPGHAGSTPASAVLNKALADFHGTDMRGKDGALNKMGLELAVLKHEHQDHQSQNARRGTNEPFVPTENELMVHDGKVVIDAVAFGDPTALRADLERLGMTNIEVAGKYVSGLLPIEAIDEAAALPGLSFANASRAMTLAGLTTTQGDFAQKSDTARASKGMDGTGVRVGVLSDSYNNNTGVPRTTAANDKASGDLPADILVLNDSMKGSDEGRAMMQIIHDVAPGSPLAFHTAWGGLASFANGIRALADNGCKVIVDDVLYYQEPMFQDGLVSIAIDDVVSRGVCYFTAAGNAGRQGYEAPFRSTGIAGPIAGGSLHDFDPGTGVDTAQQLNIPVGTKITLILQWDSPFSSLGGAFCKNDVDVFITDAAGTVRAAATAANINRDPVEILTFTNNGTINVDGVAGADTKFNLGIELYSGAVPGKLKYVFYKSGGAVQVIDFPTQSGTVFGHMNASGAETVGAVFYYHTPRYGYATPMLESFSSAGGTPILFDINGQRLPVAELRQKPEIVAPNGGNNTFFGNDIGDTNGTDTDTYPNFSGTSASAPHAAGVAALLLQGMPFMSPATVYQYMEGSAVSLQPATIALAESTSWNFDSGRGLVDANNAFPAPLLVELAAFFAHAENPTAPVRIEWSTSGEIDNVGFNVYRAVANGVGSWERGEKINSALISAEGSPSTGADYIVWDNVPAGASFECAYLLEDIDMLGNATVHGPVFAIVGDNARASVENWTSYE